MFLKIERGRTGTGGEKEVAWINLRTNLVRQTHYSLFGQRRMSAFRNEKRLFRKVRRQRGFVQHHTLGEGTREIAVGRGSKMRRNMVDVVVKTPSPNRCDSSQRRHRVGLDATAGDERSDGRERMCKKSVEFAGFVSVEGTA